MAAFDVDGVAGGLQVAGVLGLGCSGQGPHLPRKLVERSGPDVDQGHNVAGLEHLLKPRQHRTCVTTSGAGAGELGLLHGLDNLLGRPLASDCLLGDVADDCVVNPFGRAQSHGLGGGQAAGSGLVKQPLRQAAEGHTFAGQLPVQVDVLKAQVLDGHAGVPEKLAGIDSGAPVILDVLQCCNDAGFCGCRGLDELHIDHREPTAYSKLMPVVAVCDVDLIDRPKLAQLVPPNADDACVPGVVDVLLSKRSTAAGGRLALCFVLENLWCNSSVTSRDSGNLLVGRLVHAWQLALGHRCNLRRSHHLLGGLGLQSLCRYNQLGLSLLQGRCCSFWRRWCAGGRDGALGAGVRH